MNALKLEKKLAIISALVEGNSIRSTERMTGVHRDTIMRLLNTVGDKCRVVMETSVNNFHSRHIEVDEIWTFVVKKQDHLKKKERKNREIGDQYVFVALDADSKLVPVFEVGKRDTYTAISFMEALKTKLQNNGRIQLTTDAFRVYPDVVERSFGMDIDYAQLTKVYASENPGAGRYSPPEVSGVVSTTLQGKPDPEFVSTSYVERQNLTMRMAIRRFTRLTNAFSKKLENLKAALYLHFAHYNFVRMHRSLRMTPAMAAGITNRVWALEDLVV